MGFKQKILEFLFGKKQPKINQQLQEEYNSSTSPEIILDANSPSLTIGVHSHGVGCSSNAEGCQSYSIESFKVEEQKTSPQVVMLEKEPVKELIEKIPGVNCEWPQDNPEFIKNSCYRENWGIINNFREIGEKYEFNQPLVLKVVNIEDLNDTHIFISPRQLSQHFSIKPKQFYAWESSEDKLFNGKYKMEIIPFPMDESKYIVEDIRMTKKSDSETNIDVKIIPKKGVEFIKVDFKVTPTGTEFSTGNKLQMRIENLRKKKFISIADNNPELIKEWDEINNGVSASKVPHALKENAFWNCQICGDKYEMRIDNRTRRSTPGCSKCAGKKNR